MNYSEIKQLIEDTIKENLTIESNVEQARYGSCETLNIIIKYDDEEISSISYDVPNTADKDYI